MFPIDLTGYAKAVIKGQFYYDNKNYEVGLNDRLYVNANQLTDAINTFTLSGDITARFTKLKKFPSDSEPSLSRYKIVVVDNTTGESIIAYGKFTGVVSVKLAMIHYIGEVYNKRFELSQINSQINKINKL